MDENAGGDPPWGQSGRQSTAAARDLCERHLGSPATETQRVSIASLQTVHECRACILGDIYAEFSRLCKSAGARKRQQGSSVTVCAMY